MKAGMIGEGGEKKQLKEGEDRVEGGVKNKKGVKTGGVSTTPMSCDNREHIQ